MPCVRTELTVARYARARSYAPTSTLPVDSSFDLRVIYASERLESPVRCCIWTRLLARVC